MLDAGISGSPCLNSIISINIKIQRLACGAALPLGQLGSLAFSGRFDMTEFVNKLPMNS